MLNTSQINTVVWDLDGTLVDSVVDLAASVNHVLNDVGAATLEVVQVRSMIGNGVGKLLDRALLAAGLSPQDFPANEIYQRFTEHYELHCCDRTLCYPQIKDTLQALQQRGYKQGVCTNKPHVMAVAVCQHLDLQHYFSAIVGGDSTPVRKPDPQPLQLCLQQLDATASTAIMIGDSAADVAVARNCSVAVAVLPWGYTNEAPDQLDADLVLDSALHLLEILS